MSKSKPFVVPEGVIFQIEDDGVTIENAGDVVLHTDFGGRTLKRIVSREGDVELHGTVRAGEVHAAGSVRTSGAATVAMLRAGGSIDIGGNAALSDIRAGGTLSVSGNAELGSVELASGLDVGGTLTAGELRVAASVRVSGELVAKSISVGSDLSVGGGLQAGPVSAGGNVSVGGPATITGLTAGGRVSLGGTVAAGTIVAQEILLSGAAITARGLQGGQRVAIGAAKVTVDAIISPQVDVEPKTSGRVTVIESQNELGASALKGCFRLADYGEMFGNPEGFLAERGLVALGDSPVQVVHEQPVETPEAAPEAATEPEAAPDADEPGAEPPEAEAEPAAQSEEEAPEPEPVEAEAVEAEPEAVEGEPVDAAPVAVEAVEVPDIPPEATAAEPADDHATGEPARVAIPPLPVVSETWSQTEEALPTAQSESNEPVIAAVVADPVPLSRANSMHDDDPLNQAAEHPMHGQLADTVRRIVECYNGQDVPPAVEKLQELVAARQYAQIRSEITNIWSELLKFHQKKGMRIQHQVTTTFNSVNGLVKKM